MWKLKHEGRDTAGLSSAVNPRAKDKSKNDSPESVLAKFKAARSAKYSCTGRASPVSAETIGQPD
ncbi:hypothetical protein E4U16_000457 [Claviceps sp. LM84 group G4]|nr:hypothetical protein E4U16_000457 [Claviceps sp. LM84 group G4]